MSKLEVNTIEPQCGTTLTLGASGDTITLASGASQSGFGRTGTVNWDTTPKTATFTAVSGDGFFCNTTSSAFTCNLPAGSAGAIVSLADYAGTWDSNNLTVSPNGSQKIGGQNADVILSTEGQSVTFVYVDDTQGWLNVQDSTSNERGNAFITATGGTITTDGNDKIHTFTGPGTFQVTKVACCAANNLISYVVIAGGGSGMSKNSRNPTVNERYGNGGGGAGGFREVKSPSTPYTASPLDGYPSAPNRVTVTATSYPITVGAGGTAVPIPSTDSSGPNGTNSVFSTITAAGGGGGGYGSPSTYSTAGDPGGNGGGGGAGPPSEAGGNGNTPPTTPAQGQNGGPGTSTADTGAGGGGGAGAVGGTGTGQPSPRASAGGPGGAGVTTNITGSPVTYSGGGGGGVGYGGEPGAGAATQGAGGSGGGGAGGKPTADAGTNGTDNTGGGGGGAGGSNPCVANNGSGGNGGSGIVIIRYKFQ